MILADFRHRREAAGQGHGRGFRHPHVGALYLLWLGVQTIRAAVRSRHEQAASAAAAGLSSPPRRPLTYLQQGFLSDALNPKVALFFVTFLPQFLSPGAAAPRQRALLLSMIFAALYLGWFSVYVMVVERLGRLLRRPSVKARIERVTGLLLIGLAGRLPAARQSG